MDNPGVVTSEDLEYIVQAERKYGPAISVADENDTDVIDGKRSTITESFEEPGDPRFVTFNSIEDISLIESRQVFTTN